MKLPLIDIAGKQIIITNYDDAVDPSYDQLVKFLSSDETELRDYEYPGYTCGDFAERLHDNAEFKGIRCGVVGVMINLTNNGKQSSLDGDDSLNMTPYASDETCRGHALDVFNTTDRGLVYVDDTGITSQEKDQGNSAYDMIVFIQTGSELGEMRIDQAESTNYTYFELKENQFLAYQKKVKEYNNEAIEVNEQIRAYNVNYSAYILDVANNVKSDPYADMLGELGQQKIAMDNKKQELDDRKLSLEQSEESKWAIIGNMGVVSDTEIFW